MTFLLTVEVFDLRDIIFLLVRNNISTSNKEVVAVTLFLYSTILRISLIVLIFFYSLALVGRLLSTRYVSKKKSVDLLFSEFLPSFFTSVYPYRHLALIF